MKVTCYGCKETVTESYASQGVKGFAKKRKAGGTNAIALPVWLDYWLCDRCMDKKKEGVSFRQQQMI